MKLRCDGCAAYEPWENGTGRCHQNPPIGVRDVRNEMWTPFPIVNPEWWCRQHHSKNEPDQRAMAENEAAAHHPSPQAAGGQARMAAMTPEERSAFARSGAEARWNPPEDDF
jgi:hypothetical protein